MNSKPFNTKIHEKNTEKHPRSTSIYPKSNMVVQIYAVIFLILLFKPLIILTINSVRSNSSIV